ncbi:Hypothetical_protein [Hexamita inflata]|uniref:Hypothetical_protein n=1 Tax=Hexamita inflata TaxID=28002 RepID=A0AA86U9B8_9EUKA|nr:Hypothetical protein HINF_LOCUS36210 [Hexamita inflata]
MQIYNYDQSSEHVDFEDLSVQFNQLIEFSHKKPLRQIIEYLYERFYNYYKYDEQLDPDQIYSLINSSYNYQDYQTYLQLQKQNNMIMYKNANMQQFEVLSQSEYENRQQLHLRNKLEQIVRQHIAIESVNEQDLVIQYQPNTLDKEIEVQIGFSVEKEIINDIIDELKEEVFQKLKYNNEEFEQLLKKRGGRLYDIYLSRTKQQYTQQQPIVHSVHLQKENDQHLSTEENEQLIRSLINTQVPDEQEELQNTITDDQIPVEIINSVIEIEQPVFNLIKQENTVEPQQKQVQFAEHLQASFIHTTQAKTQRFQSKIFSCQEVTDELLKSAPELSFQLLIKPLHLLLQFMNHSIILEMKNTNIKQKIQSLVFDHFFLQNSLSLNDLSTLGVDSPCLNLYESHTVNFQVPKQHLLGQILQTVLEPNYNKLNQIRNQLMNIQNALNTLNSIQCSLNQTKITDRRHRIMSSHVFKLKLSLNQVLQNKLYGILQGTQKFDVENKTYFQIKNEFKELIDTIEDTFCPTQRKNLHIFDGINQLNNSIKEYLYNIENQEDDIHAYERKMAVMVVEIVKNCRKLYFDVEREYFSE